MRGSEIDHRLCRVVRAGFIRSRFSKCRFPIRVELLILQPERMQIRWVQFHEEDPVPRLWSDQCVLRALRRGAGQLRVSRCVRDKRKIPRRLEAGQDLKAVLEKFVLRSVCPETLWKPLSPLLSWDNFSLYWAAKLNFIARQSNPDYTTSKSDQSLI